MKKTPPFAPRPVWEQILQYAVIPTFDLVIELPAGGVVIVRRRIPPYKNVWALPGLRMMKNEAIEDTLDRIAQTELGLRLDSSSLHLLGQYVGRFRTESARQDLSTGYAARALGDDIALNAEHFTAFRVIHRLSDVPRQTGAMYRFYLEQFFRYSTSSKTRREADAVSSARAAAG